MAVAVLISPMHSWSSFTLGHEAAGNSYADLQYSSYYNQENEVEEQPATRCVNNGATADEDEQADLSEKVLKQVEWYFGDENLLKDSFLMKHINRNKQGYVSLKLVSSLRKVKAITKDWTTVQESVRHSTLLELNEDGTKIRRLAPVPQVDYSRLPKTIIITNYESQEPKVEDIEAEFRRHGNVAGVQILQPGKAIPLDVKSCRAQHPAIGKEVCILVEYETAESAKRAAYKNSSSENWRQTMAVKLLVEPENKSETERQSKKETGKKSKQQSKVNRLNGKYHSVPVTDYSSDSGYSGRSASNSPMPSPKLTRKLHSEQRHTIPQPTSVSRLAGEAIVRPLLHIQRPVKLITGVTVIRQPHGPDGSRGFTRRTSAAL